jgi:hypothetical protein
VPFNSFTEFNKAEGGDGWFALDEARPLACFAGLWTNWTSVRKVKEGETTNDIYALLTTEAERRGRRHPPQGDACDPDDARRGRDLDDGACGRGPEAAAAASGRVAPDRRPRDQGGSGRIDGLTS